MACNIEIKARLLDRGKVESLAMPLADSGPHLIEQQDVFFPCEGARLKLRILAPDRGELIRYERPDSAGARASSYSIAHTYDPEVLLEILEKTLGRMGVVRKSRTLYLIGQTRVHLDRVEGLGDFVELEVVLRPGQDESEGHRIAQDLMAKLGIEAGQLVAEAYVDLIKAAHISGSH